MVDLIDVVLEGFKDAIAWVTDVFREGLSTGYQDFTESVFGTPTPQTNGVFMFGTPSNAPWPSIRDALIGGDVMLLALLLLVMCVQGRHAIRIFNFGSTYKASKTKKTAWTGAFLIILWYWVSVLALYLIDGFTIALLPDLTTLRNVMVGFLSATVMNPLLGLLLAALGGISMWAIQALFFIREILLYVYVYGMPIAIALGYGNIPVLSDIATGFAKRFVPLVVLPLPAAVVFKGYDLLFASGTFSPPTAFLQYLVAVSLPVIALYLTWKTFAYATPLTAKAIGTASRGAVIVGSVAAGASMGGAGVATTAARWGPKAAAGQVIAQKAAARAENPSTHDTASYRRTENDPHNANR
ncbi:hypothetical protein C5B89_10785 [Haloferax sp. Atlit-47N]|uniref:Type IV secretion system protein TrbL n=1 Tax=Haloferax lucentense (strain DSM 14919 / JCM 9276 / NCIMB 13854 / Aa 2.2) TaxID=1230452 RepID=M0GT30_HALL2|nr:MULTISPECIES: hypothetical protein [Haloferax]ELZ75365.1 hypothetical protein C456_06842 [Haloferax lucentense DSM 14919]RDZ39021.1 hypothetical protein C5B89_10785 [Haloferax sp. Atlit-47N]